MSVPHDILVAMTEEKPAIRFITSVYGKKYGGMLLSLLYSVTKSNPHARMSIFWEDISPATRHLEKVFPQFDFIDTAHGIHGDLIDRIAHKTLLWADAAHRYRGENLVFVDVDMLVLKDISHFFVEETFDLGFTYKDDEIYPINTGTFLARASEETEEFFTLWDKETHRIVNDAELRNKATSRSYPYGAPDQMAFFTMIGYEKGKTSYKVSVGTQTLVCSGFPCTLLNETNSKPITDAMHIIHYKGGWHSILLDGTDFTSRRPKKESWDMYQYYLRTATEALHVYRERSNAKATLRDIGIRFPWYLRSNVSEKPFMYTLFRVWQKCLEPLRSIMLRWSRFRMSL